MAVKLKGAVLLGHSQSGSFPMTAALANPAGVKGMINVEGGCQNLSDQEIAKLVRIPFLVVFGDHLDVELFPGVTYLDTFNECNALIARINRKGGNAKMLHTASLGIRGNSHMLMHDKNSDQIADLIINWINKNVKYRKNDHWHDHYDHYAER